MDKCFADRKVAKRVPDVGWAGALFWGIVSSLIAALAMKKVDDWQRERKEEFKAFIDSVDAERAASNARTDLAQTYLDIDKAEHALVELQEELEKAKRERVSAETDEAKAKADRKVAERQEAVTKKEQEIKDNKAKAEQLEKDIPELDKKAKELKDKAKDSATEGTLDPADAFNSKECRDAMGDPSDRVIEERLGKDWTAWNEAKGRRPHVWDPAPEDLQPYDTLRLPFCGSDDATVSYLEENCGTPIDCLEGRPDENCGCDGAPTDDARLIESIAVRVCSDIRCPEGTNSIVQGFACVCAEPSEDGYERPPKPTPTVMAALFGNGRATVPNEGTPTFELVRKLFQDPQDQHASRDHA
jgi:hypothetical protein